MMGTRPPSDSELLNRVQQQITSVLPKDWLAGLATGGSGGQPDLFMTVTAPDGSTGQLAIEAKSLAEPKQALAAIERLRRYSGAPVLAAPFLSRRTREVLEGAGVGYVDMTGNLLLRLDRPALFARLLGEEKNPWLGGRLGRSLRGPKAARIVRLLVDVARPLSVSEIAKQTQTDTGYVSRVLDVLEGDALVERVSRGPVQRVAWEGLIRRWVDDYSVLKSNSYASYFDPRDLARLPARFDRVTVRYAITGSFAASVTEVAPPRLLMAFVDDPATIADSLSLKPAGVGANVILLRPFDPVVYERSARRDGVIYVGMSQLVADLLTGPGRMPEEAESVLAWMRLNESRWRA